MKKLTKKQKEIESDIEHYNPPQSIVKIMRELGKMGAESTGHGQGLGDEDWSLELPIKRFDIKLHIELSRYRSHHISVDSRFFITYITASTKTLIDKIKKAIKISKAIEIKLDILNRL